VDGQRSHWFDWSCEDTEQNRLGCACCGLAAVLAMSVAMAIGA